MKLFNGIFALVISLAAPVGAWADGLDEDRVKELVLETILENPGIVMEPSPYWNSNRLLPQMWPAPTC